MSEQEPAGVETQPVSGIHHVTAICGDPQENLEFYGDLLGLRFVKKTVNFDDPYTYHLYYGNTLGEPGTIMTFFPWPGRSRGRIGYGQVTVTAFQIPQESVQFWVERIADAGCRFDGPRQRFDDQVIVLEDPDGLRLELVAVPGDGPVDPWADGPVPAEHAITGFYGVTMAVRQPEPSVRLLQVMGFDEVGESGSENGSRRRLRYRAGGDAAAGKVVDLLYDEALSMGRVAVGSVHHVAWRVAGDQQQKAWQQRLSHIGFRVTPVIDRQYFRSIYFNEPNNILFEIATDPPGFTLDEEPDELGTALKLPPQYESRRQVIEERLPQLQA